jgi:hypothetical protein
VTARRLAVLLAAAVALSAATACDRGSDTDQLVLDGSPRYPDVEGVAQDVSHERVSLDGGRRYAVSRELRSFSTYTLKLEPMLSHKGQYVHLGIEDGRVVWMAAFGAPLPADPPTVLYAGELKRFDGDGRAVFRDGIVLRVDRTVDRSLRGRVTAEIDTRRRVVRSVALA